MKTIIVLNHLLTFLGVRKFPLKTIIILDRLSRFIKNPFGDALLLYGLVWVFGIFALYALSGYFR